MLEEIGKKNKIVTNEDMKDRIAYLETLRDEQEGVLRQNMIEVYKSLQPVELIKTALNNIRKDDEVVESAGGLVGGLGLKYITGRIFKNKTHTVGGFVKSYVIQHIASFLYKKNEKRITGFVGNLTRKALRKLHIREDEEPKERIREELEKVDSAEASEDRELYETQVEHLKNPDGKPLYEKDDPRVAAAIDPEKVQRKKEELDREEEEG